MGGENTKLVWRHRDTRARLRGRDWGIACVIWTEARRHPDFESQVYACCVCMRIAGWIGCVSFAD